MSARPGAGAKREAGVGAVARARTRGKAGSGAGMRVGAGAGVTAGVRGARGGASETASLVARRKREKTKSDLGLGPGLSPRKRNT